MGGRDRHSGVRFSASGFRSGVQGLDTNALRARSSRSDLAAVLGGRFEAAAHALTTPTEACSQAKAQ